MQLPPEISEKFHAGHWVLSKTGRAFHSVALDEGHEQIINKRLKELTNRPSEYRTVTLANFMAYLDKFLTLFQDKLFTLVRKQSNIENRAVHNVKKILFVEKGKGIFQSRTQKLLNILSEKHDKLDEDQRHDLLNIREEGTNRMKTYIRQQIITPPLEMPKKKLQQKMRIFSKQKTTQRAQKHNLDRSLCFIRVHMHNYKRIVSI